MKPKEIFNLKARSSVSHAFWIISIMFSMVAYWIGTFTVFNSPLLGLSVMKFLLALYTRSNFSFPSQGAGFPLTSHGNCPSEIPSPVWCWIFWCRYYFFPSGKTSRHFLQVIEWSAGGGLLSSWIMELVLGRCSRTEVDCGGFFCAVLSPVFIQYPFISTNMAIQFAFNAFSLFSLHGFLLLQMLSLPV